MNINGLVEGEHAEYLNQDKNLADLDLLAISETKLDSSTTNEEISKKLDKWHIVCRYDADDNCERILSRLNFGGP